MSETAAKESFDKKILRYSLLFGVLLLLVESANNVFSFFKEYSPGGRLADSFAAKLRECLNLLKYDVLLYVVSLVLVYLLFSHLNYQWVALGFRAVPKKGVFKKPQGKLVLFLLFQVMFFAGIFLVNAVNYPFSNHFSFDNLSGALQTFFLRDHYPFFKALGLVFVGLYFLGLIVLSLRFAAGRIKWVNVTVATVLLLAQTPLSFYVKTFAAEWLRKDRNAGPNIIIIGLDSFAPDRIGYFGYPVKSTPHLDRFLAEAVVFRNCQTPIARTFPAWYSILTGQYPRTNGARMNLGKRKYIRPAAKTLPSILKEKYGYFTSYFTDETRFSNILKDDGFDYLRNPLMGVKDFVFGSFSDFVLTNIFFNNPFGHGLFRFADINRPIAYLYKNKYFTDDIVAYLDELKTKEKFMLAVHFCGAHWPYISASPYPFLFEGPGPQADSLYDGSVKMVDDQIGRLLERLKKKGLYDRSIIVVLSDHGESAEGHGTTLKGSDQNHIVLAVKPMGGAKHRDVDEITGTVDIAPTILDLLAAGYDLSGFEGSSLEPLMNGQGEFGRSQDDGIFLETENPMDVQGGISLALQAVVNKGVNLYEFDGNGLITVKDEYMPRLIADRQRAVQTNKWKLIYEPYAKGGGKRSRFSLYDLANDLKCRKDVSSLFPDVYERMLAKLKSFYGEEISQ